MAGFLCVLSVIWLAASQSHLALTDKFWRLKYEFQQGLHPYALVVTKSIGLAATAVIQTLMFYACFYLFRRMILHQPMFYGRVTDCSEAEVDKLGQLCYLQLDKSWLPILGILVVVALCASQLGLVVSALAKWRTLVASTILPLVMMVQIIFSPFVIERKE